MISSRTPEGEFGECPVCGASVQIEPSLFYGDPPCPACGSLLWFVRLGLRNVLVRPTDEVRRNGLRNVLKELTGLSEAELNDPDAFDSLDWDSVDVVNMVMRLEDEAEGQTDPEN